MLDFIWDIHQQSQIAEAKAEAGKARDEMSRCYSRIKELEFSLQRMALACQALWELSRSRLELTEEELLAKINEIDLRDGVSDKRMSPQLATCPQCGRTLNTKNPRCIYCGTTIPKPHVFQ